MKIGYGCEINSFTNSLRSDIVLQIRGSSEHTALVISPLKALMLDQVEFLKQHISAVALMDDTKVQCTFKFFKIKFIKIIMCI